MIARASRLPLLRQCAWWSRTDVREPAQRVSGGTSSTYRGSAVHSAIEATVRGQPVPELDDESAPFFARWREWWATRGIAEAVAIEQRFVFETATSEIALVDAYDPEETGVVVGTPDLIARDADGALVVLDWKTGDDWQHYTDPAKENLQLKTYALFVARRWEVAPVRVEIVRIGTEGVTTDVHEWDALDLADHEAWLDSHVRAGVPSEPVPGLHCARCDAAAVCPATLASVHEITRPGVRLEITTENAPRVLGRIAGVREALDQVEAALKEFERQAGGIDLPDGKVWGPVEQQRTSIDLEGQEGPDAILALDELGLSAAVKTVRKVSWTDIEARAREANGGKLPKGFRASVEERLAPALRTKTVTTFTTSKART